MPRTKFNRALRAGRAGVSAVIELRTSLEVLAKKRKGVASKPPTATVKNALMFWK